MKRKKNTCSIPSLSLELTLFCRENKKNLKKKNAKHLTVGRGGGGGGGGGVDSDQHPPRQEAKIYL